MQIKFTYSKLKKVTFTLTQNDIEEIIMESLKKDSNYQKNAQNKLDFFDIDEDENISGICQLKCEINQELEVIDE